MHVTGVTFLCALILIFQSTTTAINCYVCSVGTDGCGPKFSSTGAGVYIESITLLNGGTNGCKKTVYDLNSNAQMRSTATNCSSSSNTTSNGAAVTNYCCFTDLCNGVQQKQIYLPIAVLIVAFCILIIK